jgi:hypothetical protein
MKEKRGANVERGRVFLGRGMLCGSARALSDVSARFSNVKEAESKGSNPQSGGKASCHLGSGRNEALK